MTDRDTDDLPFVSVVIPVFNEERYIQACLDSVLRQDYPEDHYEVIVADGGSTDGTRAIMESMAALHPSVRLIDNPGRTQAHGLNLGILASRGEYIARQDGHAEWSPHHLRRSIDLLLETGADNVGGRVDGEGSTTTGRAIACAMRSPFGVGGARYRYSNRLEDLPTVFPGTFRRSAFERVGLYDEAYPPHEDYELNHRIRETGGRVLFSPDIPTRYYVRESIRRPPPVLPLRTRQGTGGTCEPGCDPSVSPRRAGARGARPHSGAVWRTEALASDGVDRCGRVCDSLCGRRPQGRCRRGYRHARTRPGGIPGTALCVGRRFLGRGRGSPNRRRHWRRVPARPSRPAGRLNSSFVS